MSALVWSALASMVRVAVSSPGIAAAQQFVADDHQ
jgi:hypothetical protein